uniref:Chondroitin proteoglycan 3 n=1 Tax=Elaeophora elaphi TaxID=1147741 RepID=A0A0R3RVK3_9BILA
MFDIAKLTVLSTILLSVSCYGSKDRKSSFTPETLDFQNWTRLSRELKNEKERKPVIPVCTPLKNCTMDSDCYGGKCMGIAVGTCNCAACLQFAPCKFDNDCGGLKGSCTNQKFCDCDKGFKCAGLKGVFDALLTVCNRKECIPHTSSCFGLPCNTGICSCTS